MYLRRLRILFALGAAVIAALAVVPAACYVHHAQARLKYASLYDEALSSASQTALSHKPGTREPFNIWWIAPNNAVTAPQDFDEEPGLVWIRDAVRGPDSDGLVFQDLYPDGQGTYVLAAAERPDGNIAVAMQPLDDYHAALERLAWWLAAGVAGLIGLTAVGAWLIAGVAQAPARRAQRFQRDFLADAAHELRTPLAVIQAAVSQALSRPRTAEEYADALSETRAATERAGRAVSRLLDMARLEGGTVVLNRTPLRLDLLAEEVVEVAAAGGVRVQLQPCPPIVVNADESLLRQLLDNLVRNAAAHADSVTVTTATTRGEAEICVADDGPGFPAALLPHVFSRFARGDSRGHGIGLALVHLVVQLHGGRAEAANAPEGGAQVRVWLPLAK